MTSERQGTVSSDWSETGDANTQKYPVLFDQIINLKLYRANLDALGVATGEVSNNYVTIHSDYEPEFTGTTSESVTFHRCYQKPSISVNFKLYGKGVAPKITLKICNLNADTTTSLLSDLRADGTPFKYVEFHMGYINQFHNWETDTTAGTSAYKKFCALEGDQDGVTVIKGDILFARITKTSPDSEIEFEIIPGTAYSGIPDIRNYLPSSYLCLVGYAMVDDLYDALNTYKDAYTKETYTINDFTAIDSSAPTFSEVLFYYLISRRFWSSTLSASVFRETMNTRLNKLYAITEADGMVSVSDMASLQEYLGSNAAEAEKLLFLPDEPLYLQKVIVGTQVMKYAIPSYLRDMLAAESSENDIRLALANYISLYEPTLQATLTKIQNEVFPNMTWKDGFTPYKGAGKGIAGMNANGKATSAIYPCLYVFDSSSSRDNASFMAVTAGVNYNDINKAALEAYAYSLPMIYSLTEGAVSVCHMPFCGMFPLDYPLKFNSSYMLTDNVAYYLPTANGKSYFSCFSMEVDFSTTEEDNDCTLQMVALGDVYA